MHDPELAQARESIHEDEWTYAPPVARPVDPSEVPELGTFFFTKRATLAKLAVVAIAGALASLGGLARAIADEWNEPIAKDPSSVEHRLIPVAASATP